jgi:rhodanese-related sulfurtransferase
MNLRLFLHVARDSLAIVVFCSVVALAVNMARARPIPLVARQPYRILVPCPVAAGHADEIAPTDSVLRAHETLLIDARSSSEYQTWHIEKALTMPYDFLDRIPDSRVRTVVESGASRVVVYGDGGDPDSGRELARELASRGIRNVGYVKGGAPALQGNTP